MSQLVHLTARGVADVDPVYVDQRIALPYPFTQGIDPTRADSAIETPHFASGIELITGGFVIMGAQVLGWVRNDSDWITGADVRVWAWAPQVVQDVPTFTAAVVPHDEQPVDFDAIVHLTFSGYAVPSDDESEQ